jgi:hypothetical protein
MQKRERGRAPGRKKRKKLTYQNVDNGVVAMSKSYKDYGEKEK